MSRDTNDSVVRQIQTGAFADELTAFWRTTAARRIRLRWSSRVAAAMARKSCRRIGWGDWKSLCPHLAKRRLAHLCCAFNVATNVSSRRCASSSAAIAFDLSFRVALGVERRADARLSASMISCIQARLLAASTSNGLSTCRPPAQVPPIIVAVQVTYIDNRRTLSRSRTLAPTTCAGVPTEDRPRTWEGDDGHTVASILTLADAKQSHPPSSLEFWPSALGSSAMRWKWQRKLPGRATINSAGPMKSPATSASTVATISPDPLPVACARGSHQTGQ